MLKNFKDTRNPLIGKKIAAIGDSFVYGHTLGTDKVWLEKIANRNNMFSLNYGINGNCIAGMKGISSRFIEMENNLDYVVILGGHNDANPKNNISIGQNTDYTIDTFKGALNILINGLIKKYPFAKILFLTPFNRYSYELDYVNAMVDICDLYNIPYFNCYTSSGINFYMEEERKKYDLKVNGAYSKHLTELGNEIFSRKIEVILKSL